MWRGVGMSGGGGHGVPSPALGQDFPAPWFSGGGTSGTKPEKRIQFLAAMPAGARHGMADKRDRGAVEARTARAFAQKRRLDNAPCPVGGDRLAGLFRAAMRHR